MYGEERRDSRGDDGGDCRDDRGYLLWFGFDLGKPSGEQCRGIEEVG